MIRATCTQLTSAITNATIHRLGLSSAARTIASRSAGKAIIEIGEAHERIPDKPAHIAATTPTIIPIITATPLRRVR